MAFENLIAITFTPGELQQLDQALNTLEMLLAAKTINLTPDQRMQYGRIAEQNKLFVNKAKLYMEMYPSLVPPFIDKLEFDRDYAARELVEERLMRLDNITEKLSDTKVLLDHDNYHNAISFYRSIRYMASENVPGSTTIYEGMRQFFVTGSGSNDTEQTAQP